MRIGIGVFGAVLGLVVSARAHAQTFGERGQLALSAERLFGVTHTVFGLPVNPQNEPQIATAASQTDSINVLSTPHAAIYNAPRVAADYFVARHVSLGAAVSYSAVAQSSGSNVALVARAGYASMFSSSAGIWPRAGLTHVRFNGALFIDAHYTAITLEAPLVLSPAPRVAFTIGPTLDIGVEGNAAHSAPTRATELGLQAGLTVYLL